MYSAVAIYSGGLDSTVLLYKLRADGLKVHALSVDYGQRHKRELTHAKAICDDLGVEHRIADLSRITPLLGGSSQTDASIAVPEGHYAEESMKLTVVPNRNMIMLAVAGGWAISLKAQFVAYGAHNGDHAIYPDCRVSFAKAIDKVFGESDWHAYSLLAPFLEMSKADIVTLGAKLGVPFEKTWSCYNGRLHHCGKCGTCVERIEAFQLAGVKDPTVYE